MLLMKHPRFLQEYGEFQSKIERITDENIKSELHKLLYNLVTNVKKIDTFHQDFGVLNPNNNLIETREEITKIRKKLYSRLKECEASGLIPVA